VGIARRVEGTAKAASVGKALSSKLLTDN